MIDYCIMNRQIDPQNVIDLRTLSSANIGCDHGLVLAKLELQIKIIKLKELQTTEEKLNNENVQNEGTEELYHSRLRDMLIRH